jgi:hypothetical protein
VTGENEQPKGDGETPLPRPDSIAQAMQRALAAAGDFARALEFALNEFLDAFYLHSVVWRLEDEPQRTDAFSDAWLAACAAIPLAQFPLHHRPARPPCVAVGWSSSRALTAPPDGGTLQRRRLVFLSSVGWTILFFSEGPSLIRSLAGFTVTFTGIVIVGLIFSYLTHKSVKGLIQQ